MAHERTCALCGKQYRYCARCGEFNPTDTWMYVTCSENCRDIFNVIPKYNGGFDKAELKAELETYDLSNLENFNEAPKKILKEILGNNEIVVEEQVSTKKKSKKFVNEVV